MSGPRDLPAEGCADPVRRRHVIFVEGFDPRGAEGYFDLFRRTCEQFRRLWPITAELRPLQIDSADFAHWDVKMRGAGWQTEVRYEFMRLERFMRSDMAKPTASFLLWGLAWFFGDLLSGAEMRVFRASWRFGLHLLYFQLLLLGWLAIPVAIALLGEAAVVRYFDTATLAALASLAALVLACSVLRPLAERLGATQIGSCWLVLRGFGRGRPTWLDHAVEAGARRVRDVQKGGDTDEIVIVGHSSGSVIASAILARALELDQGCGRSRLALLTLGSVMSGVTLHPAAQRMREIVERLATAQAVAWIDCQSRKDVMGFTNFDPASGVRAPAGTQRPNPQLWQIRFKEMIAPENYRRFRRNFLRVHYQYLMAGDRPAPYDYILLVAGPAPIAEWPKQDRQLMAAFMQSAEVDRERGRHDSKVAAYL